MGEPNYTLVHARVIDVNGIVHVLWKYEIIDDAVWYRLCLDFGPEIATKPLDLPPDTPVTCLWCLSVVNPP